MGFKGFEKLPGTIKIEAWPARERETFTSYVIYFYKDFTVHITDELNYDSLYELDEFFAEEDTEESTLIIEPDYVIYPSYQFSMPRTVVRKLSNGHINDLKLYPQPVQEFYFMAGELHTLLNGPGTVVTGAKDKVIGPFGPEEDYEALKFFQFIKDKIQTMPRQS